MAAMRSVREVGAQEERSAGRAPVVRPAVDRPVVVRAVVVRQAPERKPRAVAVRDGVVRAAAVLAVAGLGLTGCMSVGPGADEKHGTVPVGQAGTVGKPAGGASATPHGCPPGWRVRAAGAFRERAARGHAGSGPERGGGRGVLGRERCGRRCGGGPGSRPRAGRAGRER